jgi:diguanylate cyclase (GGDEF)-like protein/PAS domain S-box-containing protein
MKLFNKRKFRKRILLGLLLLFVAGAGIYLSLVSFAAAAGRRVPPPNFFDSSLAHIWALFAACLVAAAVVSLSSIALYRREDLLHRRTRSALSRFRLMAEDSGDLITVMTRSGRIEYANPAVESVTGYARKDLIGRRRTPRLPWYVSKELLKAMRNEVLTGETFTVVAECRGKDKRTFTIEEHVVPFRDGSSEITHLISTARDISQERSLQEQLSYLDRYDPLTGLPNRRSLVELLEQAIARAGDGGISVLIMDINRFKQVNDLFGPGTGDLVLKQVASRVRSSVPPQDVVARIDSNEFVIVHIEHARPITAGAVAQNIRSTVSESIPLDGKDIILTATIGIALYPDHGRDALTLLKRADLAVAKAKSQGRNIIQFYDETISQQIAEFFILERNLFHALRKNEYLVNYQPYCDLSTRKISGAEALIKWNNPDLGVVSPSRFIPSLEDTGMIIEVGRWVLETACGRIKEWDRMKRNFPVSVNLSLAQFRHKYLVGMVQDAIRNFRLDPARLTLEVTETVFIQDMDYAIRTLKRLKDVGVTLSVDDFGTGYSSLSYIKRLPVDNLKIDISFVRDVAQDQDAASIVSAITALARGLELKTIAEGVETEEQRTILHLLRCDMGQGYLFSPAVSGEELEKLVMNQ